jgi:hypothetical protein
MTTKPMRYDHCDGIESIHVSYTPTLEPAARPPGWQPPPGDPLGNIDRCLACVTCGCHWTLAWELVEKGKYCPVHGQDAREIGS